MHAIFCIKRSLAISAVKKVMAKILDATAIAAAPNENHYSRLEYLSCFFLRIFASN